MWSSGEECLLGIDSNDDGDCGQHGQRPKEGQCWCLLIFTIGQLISMSLQLEEEVAHVPAWYACSAEWHHVTQN